MKQIVFNLEVKKCIMQVPLILVIILCRGSLNESPSIGIRVSEHVEHVVFWFLIIDYISFIKCICLSLMSQNDDDPQMPTSKHN